MAEICEMAVRDGGKLLYEKSLQSRLDEILKHAEAIDKREHLEKALGRLAYATFFGAEARTVVYSDFAPYSLGFAIEVKNKNTGKWEFALNGGFIYHSSAQEWSIHT